ncbi:MAG: hypothetical protein IJT44_09115 [Clostridia bacterium]|nr:hypothetical protein [Clostridia bacterium]
MAAIIHDYHFFIWLALSLAPAALYRARRLSKKGLTIAQRTGFVLLASAAGLLWSNALFVLADHVTFSAVMAALFAVMSVVAGLLIGPICYGVLYICRRASNASFLYDNRLFFALSVIWGVRLVTGKTVADTLSIWHANSYVVNYSYGFASRFLAGSILRLFAGDFVSEQEIYRFCFLTYVLLILLCSALLNRFYKNLPQKCRTAALFGIACFVCCPGSIAAMWSSGNFGKLDVYGLICALIGVALFRKMRSVPLRYLCLTLSACVAIAFYQGFVFLYFSILATVMIADIALAERGGETQKRVCCAAMAAGAVAVCFLCFQFFSTLRFANVEEMYAALAAHTDIRMGKRSMEYEYFLPLSDAFGLVENVLHSEHRRLDMLVELVLLSPLLFALVYAVIRYNRISKKLRELLNGFNLSLLTVLFIVPQFLLNVDWGRWLTAIAIDVAFIFAYWLHCGDKRMTALAKDLSERLVRNPLPYALLVLYLAMLGVFAVEGPSENVNSLYQFAFRVVSALGG